MTSGAILVIVLLLLGGIMTYMYARRRASPKASTAIEPETPNSWSYTIAMPVDEPDHEASVTFQVQPTEAGLASQAWLASYSADGNIARFTIEINRSDRSKTQGILMHFGSGRILASPNSDNSAFLIALAFALDGTVPSNIQRQSEFPFDYVHFGDDMSLLPNGAFKFNPPGDWTAMKLFLNGNSDDPEDAATVYFGLNAKGGIARLSMSMSEYGDDVLRLLAPVL